MLSFKNISIKNKIIGISLFVSLITIIIGFVFILFYNVENLREETLNNAVMNSRLIGEYCIGPLTFDDVQAADTILAKLRTIPQVETGALYDKNGILFATYKRNEEYYVPPLLEKEPESRHYYRKNRFVVEHAINYQGETYGAIILSVSTRFMRQRIQQHILMLLATLAGMFVIAFLLANQLHRLISQPILDLAQFTRKIALEGNYDLKLPTKTNDEIGLLYEDFNTMLEQIRMRDNERDQVEEKLKEAKEKAEESDRLKSAFLANMSHEIRTPMNAILGFTELLTLSDAEITTEEKEHYIDLIQNSGNSLLHLIDDIIDISKIEAGQLKIIYKDCDLDKLLHDLVDAYQEIKKKRGKSQVDVRLHISENAQKRLIRTDPHRLNQVISNLLDNALKFTDSGFIELGCTTLTTRKLQLYVKDTGIGMDKHKQQIVFDRFYKVEDDKTKLYRGAGLGLAICKSLVDMLGGQIWVDSEPRKGSLFTFTIPLIPAKQKREARIKRSQGINHINWHEKNILIAEDEPTNFAYLKEVLKPTHATIIHATNGREAIEIIQSKQVDIIIMDIKMPVMNGFEAAKIIKGMAPHIPIISQTAYAMESEMEVAKYAGMDDYLVKPLKPAVLISAIQKQFSAEPE
ncbi:MAG: ATP-binding protein [Bacteroidales bacterium]